MGALSKLTAIAVQRLQKRGRYSDGGGLYLQVSDSGSKAWLFRYMIKKQARSMGLGSLDAVSLARAREKAAACRALLADGIDPIEAKIADEKQKALEAAKVMTFGACTDAFIENVGAKWKNRKHRNQWRSTLATYANPIIGDLPVHSIDTSLVLKILEPIWKEKTETASRVRGRVEAVLNYATAREWRVGDNPARWRGHLDRLLAKPTEIKPVKHHAALAVHLAPAFAQDLRRKTSPSSKALELLLLTALRPGELIGGEWEEVNFKDKIWTVPSVRMKKKVEHRIPLSARALELLERLKSECNSAYIFPGLTKGHMTTATMLKLVKEMLPDLDLTTHGFRSTFRDWTAEYTNFSNEVAEMALAHKIKSKSEAAYRRGDLLLKRRALMERWSQFLLQEVSESSILAFGSKPA